MNYDLVPFFWFLAVDTMSEVYMTYRKVTAGCDCRKDKADEGEPCVLKEHTPEKGYNGTSIHLGIKQQWKIKRGEYVKQKAVNMAVQIGLFWNLKCKMFNGILALS